MGKLDGRVAIVTGGGRGIGRATRELFAREGARVVVATRTAAPGQETVDAILAAGGEAILVELDVGGRAAVRALVERSVRHFGGLDIVLHDAAYIPYGALGQLDDAKLDQVFDVGVKAAFWLMTDALPRLEKSRAGRFLVTSSVAAGHEAISGLVHYSSVKAALNGFVRAAAFELAPRGITVNGIEPGLTLTHSLEVNANPETIAAMSARIPIARPADAREIAAGFLYLASDEAAYITGQLLTIDGGATLGHASKPRTVSFQAGSSRTGPARPVPAVRRHAHHGGREHRPAVGGPGDRPQPADPRPVHRGRLLAVGRALVDCGSVLGPTSGTVWLQEDGDHRPFRLHRLAAAGGPCPVGRRAGLGPRGPRLRRLRRRTRHLWLSRRRRSPGGTGAAGRPHLARRPHQGTDAAGLGVRARDHHRAGVGAFLRAADRRVVRTALHLRPVRHRDAGRRRLRLVGHHRRPGPPCLHNGA